MISKFQNKLKTDTHLKEILTGSAITFLLKMGGMVLGYALIVVISRLYGAEGVGIYSLSVGIMVFLSMVACMGINVSILRFVGQFNKASETYKLKQVYNNSFQLVLPASLVLASGLYLYANKIAVYLLKNMEYTRPLMLIAFILPFYVLQDINVEFIRGIKKLQISEYFRSINSPLFSIILLFIAMGLVQSSNMLPLYTLGIGILIGALYSFIFIQKHLGSIDSFNNEKLSKKELITTSFPMMVTAIASFAMGNIAIILLEIYSTTHAVGIFSVIFKISMFLNITLIVINTISAPKFSELFWARKYKELQTVLDHSSRSIFLSSLVLAAFILLFKSPLLSMFGNEFNQGGTALFFLMIGQMVNAVSGSVGIFMNMAGQQKVLRNSFVLALLVNTTLQIILIPNYGIDGAAFSTMAGTIVVNLIPVIFVRRKMGFKTYYSPISKL